MSNPSEMERAEGSPETVDEALDRQRDQREKREQTEFGIPADQTPEEIQDNEG